MGLLTPMSGTVDKNWMSYTGPRPDVSTFVNPPDPENYDDIMKFSDCSDAYVSTTIIAAGQENCVDAVRGSNYLFSGCSLLGGSGVSSATLKGSIVGWEFNNCGIGRGEKTDIEVGQFDKYWYAGRPPTTGGVIDSCYPYGGEKIRVTCWDADKPEVTNSMVEIIKVPWIIWFPYFCFRYIWIRIFP